MTDIDAAAPRPVRPLTPDLFEKVLAAGAIVLFALVAVALFKGRAELASASLVVWPHLATVLLALAITPYQLLRPRGSGVHRGLGWIWAIAMFVTALASFAIRTGGGFSLIHILSVVTVVTVPLMVLAARRHRIARHRRAARILVTAALLIAGYFTLIPTRMLGMWLWS
jgi:uncharacterized membrane protein